MHSCTHASVEFAGDVSKNQLDRSQGPREEITWTQYQSGGVIFWASLIVRMVQKYRMSS